MFVIIVVSLRNNVVTTSVVLVSASVLDVHTPKRVILVSVRFIPCRCVNTKTNIIVVINVKNNDMVVLNGVKTISAPMKGVIIIFTNTVLRREDTVNSVKNMIL
jgi:hypothetical protein